MAITDSGSSDLPADQFQRLRQLAADNVAGNTRLLSRLNDLLRDAALAAGRGTGAAEGDRSALLSRWLDFNLDSYAVVSRHSLALADELISVAESALRTKAPPTTDARPEPPSRPELRLSARPGERATSGFVVENNFERPFAVTAECDELRTGKGAALPASLVHFDPPSLEIPARGEAIIRAAVSITPEFVVGETYTTTIRLLGLPAREVGLSVTVLAASEPADPVGKPAEPADKPVTPPSPKRSTKQRPA